MASTGGGKIRSKRSKVTNKPYARRTSLLGSVTETVRDFITPSWLSNVWQSAPEEDDVDLPAAGGSGGTIDEGRGTLYGFPPQGRINLEEPIPEQDERQEGDSDDNDPDIILEDEQQPSANVMMEDQPSTSAGQRSRNTPFNPYAKPVGASTPNDDIQIIAEKKAPVRDDDASDTSVSTSGCSSLIPNVDMADHRAKLSKFNLDRLSAEMSRNPGDPHKCFRSDSPRLNRPPADTTLNTSLWSEASASGRSSPFGNRPTRPQQSAHSSRRPTFNSSYFCSPRGSSSFGSTTVTDSPGRASPFSSPFYPGKTTFGGSSAQRPAKRPRTSPYEVHLPVKRHVRIRPSNRNEEDVTSQTAKRILETLEKMSTPLSDAKKIPLSPTSSPFSFTPGRSTRLRRPAVPHAPGVQERVKMPGPPTRGMQMPQRVSIAHNRQPPILPDTKREPKTEAKPETVSTPPEDTSPRLAAASPPSAGFSFKRTPSTSTTAPARTQESRLSSLGGAPNKSGGKMRSSKRETHYKSPIKEEDDIMEVPDLPHATLSFPNGKTPPTFQFNAPPPAAGASSSGSAPFKPQLASTPSPFGMTSAASKGSGAFKFAPPTDIAKDSAKSTKSEEPAPSKSLFKFSTPKQAGTPEPKSTGFGGFQAKTTPAFGGSSSSGGAASTLVKKSPEKEDEEEEEPSGGIKVAKELKTGSCLEVFGMASKPNKNSADKAKSSSSAASSSKPPSLADKFKPAAGAWRCDSCMVQNKPDTDKCACCMAPKPGGSKPAEQPKPLFGQSSVGKTDNPAGKNPVVNCGFGDKFKKPAGQWTCDACLVSNKAELTTCAACTMPKPGAVNSSSAAVKAPSSSAMTTAPIGFGDKFKPVVGSWSCDTCMLSNKSTVSRCVACETPKPGNQQSLSAPPASVYKFGTSSTTSSSSSEGGFKFGAPSTANQSTGGSITSGAPFKSAASIASGAGGFKFGAPSTPVVAESKSDAAAAPFKFGQSADDTAKSSSKPKPGGFQFGNPTSTLSSTSDGFKFGGGGGSLANDKDGSGAPPPNADPFKSGAFSASETTKPVASVATLSNTATDSVAKAAKETPALSKPQFNFGAPATSSGAKTDNALSISTGSSGSTEQKATFNFGGPKKDGDDKQSTTANAAFKFGAATATTEQKDTASNKPAFNFGGGAGSSAPTDTTKSIFGGTNQPPSQAKASSEQSAGKPLFNFKSNTTNTSFQFGGAAENKPAAAAEPKPAQENKPAFNFSASSAAESKSGFNFGVATKTTENKDAGSSNNVAKSSPFMFGASTSASNSTTNTSSTTPAASVTPFKFGDSSATQPAQNSSSPFVFGATPAASTNSQPAAAPSGGGGFSFTASAPATTQQPAPAFGASNTTSNSVFGGFGSNASSANPSPVFGNPAPTTTSTSIPNFGTTASTPFGSQNQQQGAAAPAFGAATTGTPFGGSPAPAFGAGSTPAFGAAGAAPAFGNNASSTPAFGNANATQQNAAFQQNATPAFQFGGSSQPAQQNSGVFKFGASQNNNTASGGQNSNSSSGAGFNFNAQSPPSYNFTGAPSAPSASAGASPFQFNASSGSNASNPFNPMPSSGSTHSGRKIKRAVRRNVRK